MGKRKSSKVSEYSSGRPDLPLTPGSNTIETGCEEGQVHFWRPSLNQVADAEGYNVIVRWAGAGPLGASRIDLASGDFQLIARSSPATSFDCIFCSSENKITVSLYAQHIVSRHMRLILLDFHLH